MDKSWTNCWLLGKPKKSCIETRKSGKKTTKQKFCVCNSMTDPALNWDAKNEAGGRNLIILTIAKWPKMGASKIIAKWTKAKNFLSTLSLSKLYGGTYKLLGLSCLLCTILVGRFAFTFSWRHFCGDSFWQCTAVPHCDNEKCSFAVPMRSLMLHFRDRPVRPVGHSDVTQFSNVAIHLSPDSESLSKFTCMQKSVYMVS